MVYLKVGWNYARRMTGPGGGMVAQFVKEVVMAHIYGKTSVFSFFLDLSDSIPLTCVEDGSMP